MRTSKSFAINVVFVITTFLYISALDDGDFDVLPPIIENRPITDKMSTMEILDEVKILLSANETSSEEAVETLKNLTEVLGELGLVLPNTLNFTDYKDMDEAEAKEDVWPLSQLPSFSDDYVDLEEYYNMTGVLSAPMLTKSVLERNPNRADQKQIYDRITEYVWMTHLETSGGNSTEKVRIRKEKYCKEWDCSQWTIVNFFAFNQRIRKRPEELQLLSDYFFDKLTGTCKADNSMRLSIFYNVGYPKDVNCSLARKQDFTLTNGRSSDWECFDKDTCKQYFDDKVNVDHLATNFDCDDKATDEDIRQAEVKLLRQFVEGYVGQRMTLPTPKIGNMLVIWTNYDLFDMDPIWNELDMLESAYYVHVRVVRLLDGDYVDRMYVRPPQENLDWLIEGRLATVNTFADLPDAQDERGIINYCTLRTSNYAMFIIIPIAGTVVLLMAIGCFYFGFMFFVHKRDSSKITLVSRVSVTPPTTPGFRHSGPCYHPKSDDMSLHEECKWEIESGNLIIKDTKLGSGAFSNVYEGQLIGQAPVMAIIQARFANQTYSDCKAAIKMLPEYHDEMMKKDFMEEIRVMKEVLHHPHLVNLLGCITITQPMCAVLEYCTHGSLLHLVRRNKSFTENNYDNELITANEYVSFAWQMADGMAYFSSRGYLHRDLAARNILITEHRPGVRIAKVADFGLCRHMDKDVYTSRGGRLPIKWMSIEALDNAEFSQKSDVWSYAVALWEMYSQGRTPMANIEPISVLPYLRGDDKTPGARLEQPALCPDDMYDVMMRCWSEKVEDRPTFNDLRRELYDVLPSKENYLDYMEASSMVDYAYMDPKKGNEYVNAPGKEEGTKMVAKLRDHEYANKTVISKSFRECALNTIHEASKEIYSEAESDDEEVFKKDGDVVVVVDEEQLADIMSNGPISPSFTKHSLNKAISLPSTSSYDSTSSKSSLKSPKRRNSNLSMTSSKRVSFDSTLNLEEINNNNKPRRHSFYTPTSFVTRL